MITVEVVIRNNDRVSLAVPHNPTDPKSLAVLFNSVLFELYGDKYVVKISERWPDDQD